MLLGDRLLEVPPLLHILLRIFKPLMNLGLHDWHLMKRVLLFGRLLALFINGLLREKFDELRKDRGLRGIFREQTDELGSIISLGLLRLDWNGLPSLGCFFINLFNFGLLFEYYTRFFHTYR